MQPMEIFLKTWSCPPFVKESTTVYNKKYRGISSDSSMHIALVNDELCYGEKVLCITPESTHIIITSY